MAAGFICVAITKLRQKRYSIHELETVAVEWGAEDFRIYVLG